MLYDECPYSTAQLSIPVKAAITSAEKEGKSALVVCTGSHFFSLLCTLKPDGAVHGTLYFPEGDGAYLTPPSYYRKVKKEFTQGTCRVEDSPANRYVSNCIHIHA